MAFKDGMTKAASMFLEPIMKVEVETPEEYMGDVMGDLKLSSWQNFGNGEQRGISSYHGRSSFGRDVWLCNDIAFYD